MYDSEPKINKKWVEEVMEDVFFSKVAVDSINSWDLKEEDSDFLKLYNNRKK